MSCSQSLTRKEAAEFLRKQGYRISPATLARLATSRKGPPYTRFLGRVVSYDSGELLDWARSQSQRVEPNGEIVA